MWTPCRVLLVLRNPPAQATRARGFCPCPLEPVWADPDGQLMTQPKVSGSARPPQPIRIAPLFAADAPSYRALMLHAYQAAADAFTSTGQERAAEPLSWWTSRIADPQGRSQVFGAFIGHELVGAVALELSAKTKTRHKAHLMGMFVAETARAGGAGRALVQAAMRWAADRPGLRVVTLTVTDGNAPAIALYESCGFRIFGVEPMAIATPDGFKAKVHMAWQMPPAPAAPSGAVPLGMT